jgi:hypothetical protein
MRYDTIRVDGFIHCAFGPFPLFLNRKQEMCSDQNR